MLSSLKQLINKMSTSPAEKQKIEVIKTAYDPKSREVMLLFDNESEHYIITKCEESFIKITEESAEELFTFLSHDTQAFPVDFNV